MVGAQDSHVGFIFEVWSEMYWYQKKGPSYDSVYVKTWQHDVAIILYTVSSLKMRFLAAILCSLMDHFKLHRDDAHHPWIE